MYHYSEMATDESDNFRNLPGSGVLYRRRVSFSESLSDTTITLGTWLNNSG
jgi:hypothetical protein